MTKFAYSIDEVAAATSVGRTKTYQLIRDGILPAKKIGSRTIILKTDLENFLENLEKR